MLDYIFFDSALLDKFKDHLTKVGINFQHNIDQNFGSIQGEIISIDENTDESTLKKLQILYDVLQDELEQNLEKTTDALTIDAAGMQVKLNNGQMCTLRVDPDVVTRILTVLEFDELQAFVDNIAKSVQDPDDGHFCHI